MCNYYYSGLCLENLFFYKFWQYQFSYRLLYVLWYWDLFVFVLQNYLMYIEVLYIFYWWLWDWY